MMMLPSEFIRTLLPLFSKNALVLKTLYIQEFASTLSGAKKVDPLCTQSPTLKQDQGLVCMSGQPCEEACRSCYRCRQTFPLSTSHRPLPSRVFSSHAMSTHSSSPFFAPFCWPLFVFRKPRPTTSTWIKYTVLQFRPASGGNPRIFHCSTAGHPRGHR